MSIKSTQRISREMALAILLPELSLLPNDVLATLLDTLADSGHSHRISRFDNFIVSDFVDEDA